MKHGKYLKKFQNIMLAASLAFSVAVSAVPVASAAPAVSAPFTASAKVSFTFDDGLASSSTLAAPVLAKYGYPGVDYVITDCIGMTTTPNTCAADPNHVYMTWSQVADLQATYGWEVASHTVSHPQLATDRTSGVITAQQMIDEINNSKSILNSHGFAANNFADPYGDYDNTSIAAIAKTYTSHRGFADIDYNAFPYNDYLLTVQQVQGNVSVATVKGYIDQAKAQGKWLILVFHEIKASGASTALEDYEYNADDLDQIAAYVQAQGVPVTDIAHGLANSATNLFTGGGFASGIADGWTTDSPTTIVADSNNNGSYDGTASGATHSVSFTGSTNDAELFSPTVAIDATQNYVVKSFVNVTSTSGEIDFFVDEYDASGTWLSGKYFAGLAGTTTASTIAVKNVNFVYTATSATVAKVRLQVIVHGTAAKAYVDNVQLFPVSAIGGTVVIPPVSKAGDVNGDNAVDGMDLSILLSNWNKTSATKAQGDLSGDAVVDGLDLSTLLANWGK